MVRSMADPIKTITSLDGNHRVEVFQRPEGTFGFDEFYFDEEEQAWCMVNSREGSYPVFDTLKRALQEIAGRIPWAHEVNWA
jgi:hypothetical protein